MLKEMVESGFICTVCGQPHEGIPLSFAADFPDLYANLSEADREARTVVSSDQCIVDGQWFFLRGCLEIPIIGTPEVFLWGLWASVKEEVFNQISASWEEEGREERHGPFKARLANSLTTYPGSLNLKLSVLLQSVGTRPLFVLEEPEHPMGIAQKQGISKDEAVQISAALLHNV